MSLAHSKGRVPERLLTTAEAGEIVGKTYDAMRMDRYRNQGVPYIRDGRRRVMYRLSDIEAYLDEHRVVPGGGPHTCQEDRDALADGNLPGADEIGGDAA